MSNNFPQAPLAADLGGPYDGGTQQDALQWRRELVAEARSWIGTPYVTGGRVKQAGCDCCSFVLSALQNCGLARDEELEVYSGDCWAHWTEEKYLYRLMKHAVKIAETVATRGVRALPGTIVLGRVVGARVYNHAAIVTAWPLVVHALPPEVCEADASREPLWIHREVALFDPFAKRSAACAAVGREL